MNYSETFNDFASRVTPTDLALYAGVGIVLWVLFKDNLSPVQSMLKNTIDKIKQILSDHSKKSSTSVYINKSNEDVFFKLVSSWKQTRDLAVLSGCKEAVKVADQMFPHLSPELCKQENQT